MHNLGYAQQKQGSDGIQGPDELSHETSHAFLVPCDFRRSYWILLSML